MDIGILPEFRNPTQWAIPIEQVYREGIEKAVAAERLGFDHFWTSEHHFAVDSWSPSLLTILAAAAALDSVVITNHIIARRLPHADTRVTLASGA